MQYVIALLIVGLVQVAGFLIMAFLQRDAMTKMAEVIKQLSVFKKADSIWDLKEMETVKEPEVDPTAIDEDVTTSDPTQLDAKAMLHIRRQMDSQVDL